MHSDLHDIREGLVGAGHDPEHLRVVGIDTDRVPDWLAAAAADGDLALAMYRPPSDVRYLVLRGEEWRLVSVLGVSVIGYRSQGTEWVVSLLRSYLGLRPPGPAGLRLVR